jgi:hypothetical protein
MGRTWVPIAAAVVGIVFVITQLTGSDVDEHAAQAVAVAVLMVLFTALGSTGIALAIWQPRFSPLGLATATLSLLAFGATAVLTWSSSPSLFFGFIFGGTSGTVAGITDLVAIASAAICVLVATIRSGEDGATRLVRVAAVGALTLLVALAILTIVVDGVEIGPRVYAILATVYVAATAVLLIFRLLPAEEDFPAVAERR